VRAQQRKLPVIAGFSAAVRLLMADAIGPANISHNLASE
jgi:hypothetical protein